jgi:hypothetical protein
MTNQYSGPFVSGRNENGHMASQIHIFFAAAREKAAQDRAVVVAKEEAERQRKNAQRVNMDALKAELRDEFCGFFDALTKLSAKEGKHFAVTAREDLPANSSDASCHFTALYGVTPEHGLESSSNGYAKPQSGFGLSILRKAETGKLEIKVTEYWLTEHHRHGGGSSHKTEMVADFAALWKILGTGVGGFAPEHIEDLSRLMGFGDGQNPAASRQQTLRL